MPVPAAAAAGAGAGAGASSLGVAGIVLGAYNMLKGQPPNIQQISNPGVPAFPLGGSLGQALSVPYDQTAQGIQASVSPYNNQGPGNQAVSNFLGTQSGLGQAPNGNNFYNEYSGGSNLYNSLKQGDNLQFGNFA